MTSLRRRISLFSRSSELLLHSCRQRSFGKPVKARISRPDSSRSAAASGKRPSSWATMRPCCSRTASAAGCAKIERTIVATKDCALLGTRVSRLHRKCVRQRCQAAPGRLAAIASTRPGWASEVTRRTPVRPRATSERRKASQAGAVLARDDVEAERLAEAVAVDRDRVHDADGDRAPPWRHVSSSASRTRYG
jgi:hypothetical protein